MKKNAKKLSVALIIITALIISFAIIFYNGVLNEKTADPDIYEHISSPLVNSETVYIILFALLIIPFSMIALAISVITSTRPIRNEEKIKRKKKKIEKKKKKEEAKNSLRFPRLAKIDKELATAPAVTYTSCPLDELCLQFRNFAASRLGLYYDISDIRRFIAGMGMSRLIILKGMSGTGKTSLAYAAGEFFGNSSTIVPIQPMWKERSDIIGYFNEFTKKFSESTLLTKLYEAGGKRDIYITVLDEVNISRIEYYFAEFLSLLEIPDPRKRYIDVVSDTWENDPKRLYNGKLALPVNMWFVGTANNDDSTFAISDKVYDRASVMDLERKCTPFDAPDTPPCHMACADLGKLFRAATTEYALSSDARDRLSKLDEYMKDIFRISFGNRIMKQIESYIPIMLACGGSESEALDDILARKILRKLEQLSPAYVKSEAGALEDKLDELFGEGTLKQSHTYIERLSKGF